MHFYFDVENPKSSGAVYNDDGSTPNSHEKGMYEILVFNSEVSKNNVVIKLKTNSGQNYTSTDKNITLVVHNIKPKRIYIDGQELLFKTFQEPLQIPVTWKKGTNPEIKIEY